MLSVDTFFFMSSFLLTFHVISHLRSKPGIKKFLSNVPFIYIKRLVRLTPAFYYLYLMYWQIGPMLINGANMTANFDRRFQDCKDTWPQELLYVRNLFDSGKGARLAATQRCLVSAWYLDVDTQVSQQRYRIRNNIC